VVAALLALEARRIAFQPSDVERLRFAGPPDVTRYVIRNGVVTRDSVPQMSASGRSAGPARLRCAPTLVSRVGSRLTVGFRDDGVGVFGPDKGLAAFVPAVDEPGDRFDQVTD
jgi:hypothetical protein